MKKTYVIAYDVGTSSVKAALFDDAFELKDSVSEEYPVYEYADNFVEQEPSDYWNAVCSTTKEVIKNSGITAECISAIAFSCQSMGIIPVDENGEVLYRNISWLDGRAGSEAAMINAACGQDILGAKDVIPKLLWLKGNEPDVWEKCRYIMHVNGYLCMKCTGRFTSEITGAASYGLDLESLSWPEEMLTALGIGTEKFPSLIKSTDEVGRLTAEAASEMGLTTDVCVYGGCDDVQAAALGSGTGENGEAHIYIGSSGWLSYTTDKIYPMLHGAAMTKSADAELNILVGVNQSVCITLNWMLEKFYANGGALNDRVYEIMESETAEISAGADRLMVTPWLFGEYAPIKDDDIKATFFNVNSTHTRAHFMRATMEGIAYNLKWILDNYRDDYGVTIDRLVLFGGGTKSSVWMQIMTDVFGKPVSVLENHKYVGAMGAAACAVAGRQGSCKPVDLKKYVSIHREFAPDKEKHALYSKYYQVFRALYEETKALSTKLNSIG